MAVYLVRALAEYQCRRYRKKGPYNKDKWQLRNAEHEVRDRWTVSYAHRHSFHEAIGWYVESQLDYKLVNPVAYFDRLHVPFFGIGIRGTRAAQSSPDLITDSPIVPLIRRGVVSAPCVSQNICLVPIFLKISRQPLARCRSTLTMALAQSLASERP
jgi:hypothetical protein